MLTLSSSGVQQMENLERRTVKLLLLHQDVVLTQKNSADLSTIETLVLLVQQHRQ